jgi:hypothetical protein
MPMGQWFSFSLDAYGHHDRREGGDSKHRQQGIGLAEDTFSRARRRITMRPSAEWQQTGTI